MRSIALRLTVLVCAFAAMAQDGPPSERKATYPTAVASPLDGNWQITGNREYKQYPLISMAIHVNGKQITAHGDRFITCPTSPSYGNGGSFTLTGEIGPDSSFTLRQHDIRLGRNAELLPPINAQLTITGKLPAPGSTSWGGTYTITGKVPLTGEPKCSQDQGGAFTASRLAPLTGTFSGPLQQDGTYMVKLKFNITAEQGEFASWTKKVGTTYTYLPLTGTITVEGSPCFKHGTADAGVYNTMEGDLAHMRFKMEDGSELWTRAFYTNPEATGLKVAAEVSGGKCDKQQFFGTLSRQ